MELLRVVALALLGIALVVLFLESFRFMGVL